MLFNSYIFVFVFLPLTLGAFYLFLKYAGGRAGVAVLMIASLVFYTYWYPPYLALLMISMAVNYICGRMISARAGPLSRMLLWVGVGFNLALLGYYKYAGFLLENWEWMTGASGPALSILLPLGISFYTFQQIAYLVDVYQRKVIPSDVMHYVLFVTFFPQLIAGPIVHGKDILPQFDTLPQRAFRPDFVAAGAALFTLGLFKKVGVADTLALHADPLFAAVENGFMPSFIEAWSATLSYTFQIYFDFSGYTDMALGLGLIMGIKLPPNFNAPYKATGYIEFWRRWHMTLSHFLRDYVYIPLGGNRHGKVRHYLNLIGTMLIGGLWHGASWNFVLWGGLHGAMIALNHAVRIVCPAPKRWMAAAGWLFTFVTLCFLWVLFRAESFSGAQAVYAGLLSIGDITWPQNVWHVLPHEAQDVLARLGGQAGNLSYLNTVMFLPALLSAGLVCFFLPNTVRLFSLDADAEDQPIWGRTLRFAPTARWASLCACLMVLSLMLMQRESPFLYFQF